MNKKITYWALTALVVILAIVAVLSIINMETKYDITEDVSELKAEAQQLYNEGNLEDAITILDMYCQYSVTDISAKAMLGDWYIENGKHEKAYECYLLAASNKQATGDIISPLTIKNTEEVVLIPAEDYSFEITPDVRLTKDMTLTITGQNLAPETVRQGKINGKEYQLTDEDRFVTTDWFDVNPEGSYLTMSGGFNCAVWQFANSYGEIIAYAESPNTYRRQNTSAVDIYQMARVIIPEKAAQCRVTYFDTELGDVTASPEEPMTIVYGRLPGQNKTPQSKTYNIPDIKDGEKLTYKDGVWKFCDQNGQETVLDWEIPSLELGSHLSVSGRVPGRVSFESSTFLNYEKDKIYTVRFDTDSPSNTGERLDDAKNMAFNGAVGTSFLSMGNNTFDNAYPWSEIKVCAIKDGVITYKGEEGFSDLGDAGDVFVEIPKFYSKRTVSDGYETISISGYPHEGFEVDEAFVTETGEADAIYIAAYTSSLDENFNIQSASKTAPLVDLSPDEMVQLVEKKGEGYKVMDYAALSAIQKLFLVETGVRNSQCLYMGICALTIASAPEDEIGYSVAIASKNKTNCIEINSGYTYNEGDSIVVYTISDYEKSYNKALQSPRRITAVVDNGDLTVSVFFDGEPMDVTADDTAIAHIAKNNGDTDSIGYHTGASATTRGIHSFKYRHMENIWGNVHTYVDKVSVKNGRVHITDRKGDLYTLSYSLPTADYAKNTDTMIKKLGYDPDHSGIMLPSVTGEGATSSTYYGDAYFHTINPEAEYALHYGGGWNSTEGAGLFSYATLSGEDEGSMNASCRMMYIK